MPHIRESKGCIVFTSSGASSGLTASWAAYATSKAAINCLAAQVAVEEPDLTSIAFRPGVVATDMQQELRTKHFGTMAKKDSDRFRGLHERGEMLSPNVPGHIIANLVRDPPKQLSGKYVRSVVMGTVYGALY